MRQRCTHLVNDDLNSHLEPPGRQHLRRQPLGPLEQAHGALERCGQLEAADVAPALEAVQVKVVDGGPWGARPAACC